MSEEFEKWWKENINPFIDGFDFKKAASLVWDHNHEKIRRLRAQIKHLEDAAKEGAVQKAVDGVYEEWKAAVDEKERITGVYAEQSRKVDKLEAQLEKAKEVLKYYTTDRPYAFLDERDKRAREFLAKLEGKK